MSEPPTPSTTSQETPPAPQKESSMLLQKQMLADYFDDLGRARETGRKVVYTFVPGNLTELIRSFDLLPVYPEINALQSGMRKRSDDYIAVAERYGHSEDVCTYVKSDIGMMLKGNIGPTGQPLPSPDLLLLSYVRRGDRGRDLDIRPRSTGCNRARSLLRRGQPRFGRVPRARLYRHAGRTLVGSRCVDRRKGMGGRYDHRPIA